ncbi:hypothetical protein N3K66_001894 [Trichothecium roseum]|uniref:Uncharacterized protein n=1 Tax=Trichothecium roseum TaxID=47278 RepID=A0ACC0V9G9_9HYPO|nr:hypothetical protein N3K66_001894 [Trichothecium roseum]
MELATRGVDNDTRGWIMCIVSGIACVAGASIICVDSLVRLFPGKRNFRIEESNVFLACSLSLSFGVMMFSSLYSMLPESRGYLKKHGLANREAGLIMMACFIGGFFGIQAISRLLHQFMPTHVVDCDHTHDDNVASDEHSVHSHSHRQSRSRRRESRKGSSRRPTSKNGTIPEESSNGDGNGRPVESTPLLQGGPPPASLVPKRHASVIGDESVQQARNLVTENRSRATTNDPGAIGRRPSMLQVQKRVMSFVKDTKCNCNEMGSCYGYTDPCGQECFKHIAGNRYAPRQLLRTTTGPFYPQSGPVFQGPHTHDEDGDSPVSPRFRTSHVLSRDLSAHSDPECGAERAASCHSVHADEDDDPEAQHHHHVPTNAFLSIGLQTSIAIALHKFPEGFITYATNHANPSLGFNVFMALFVHNISEGFALALPLYMALGSRWRALFWSSVLGGLSQPLGAAIAVGWFKLASHTHFSPNAVAYACLFAVTAGIMVSVALQLFVESLSLNHNRNLCIFCGFLGMAILGLSNALFGGH